MDYTQDDSRIVIVKTKNTHQMLHDYGAFYLKDHNLAFYIGTNRDIEVPGKKMVEAHSYFIRKILRDAMRDANTYLSGRMSEHEIYHAEQFWQDALRYAGRTILPHTLWIDYRTAPYGYLIVHTADCSKSLCYHFADDTYMPKSDGKQDRHAATAMELCYHGLLDQMLAQRHAGVGTAPDAYMEIAGINSFLKNKRSVHSVYKDGSSCQSFDQDKLTVGSLFQVNEGRLVVRPGAYKLYRKTI